MKKQCKETTTTFIYSIIHKVFRFVDQVVVDLGTTLLCTNS